MGRRRSCAVSWRRAGTMMLLRESPLTVGPEPGCLSLRGALEARAGPNSRRWQHSRRIQRYRPFAPLTLRNTARATELLQRRLSIFREKILRPAPSFDILP